jgi:hypothetical protein
MIPVKEITQDVFEVIDGNPTLLSLDGEEKATLATLLADSWTDQDRARFGVYLATPFVLPDGKVFAGNERYERQNGTVVQLFDVADPPPPTLEDLDNIAKTRAIDTALELSALNMIEGGDISDDERLSLIGIYPRWQIGEQVGVGNLRRYESALYRCVQAHVTQADWTPPQVPALWTEVAPPGTIAAWVQPTGAHDAYAIGAVVTHNGQTWICTTDANVWEPGVFGWSVYTP